MSLEEQLAANTAALEANTAALNGTKASGSAGDKGGRPAPRETAAAKKKREAAERKTEEDAAAAAAAAAEEEEENEEVVVEPRKSISIKALGKVLGDYMGVDDEDEAAEREEAVVAAFDHLGVESLGGLEDPEDRVKMALYADNWIAGNEVVFEDCDELLAPEKKDKKKDKKKLLG